ncbi:hypothetical protein J6T66_02760 [bacterium]|nr:hypothetical protein [bacterium]
MDEDVVSDEEKVTDEEVTKSEEILADEEKVTSDEEIISDNEETVSEEEEISDEDIIPDEKLSFDFTSDAEGEAEESEVTNQDEERHLFKQPDEDSNEEISFDINIPSNSNETFQPDESVSDKTLFMGAEDTSTSESVEGN